MEAEPFGPRVGLLQCVGNRAHGVKHAADSDENDDCRPPLSPHLRQEPHGRPTQDHVDKGGKPTWCGGPEEVDADSEQSTDPHDAQQDHPVIALKSPNSDGRLGAGNQEKNVGVVKALQNPLKLRLPVEEVVQGRHPKQNE